MNLISLIKRVIKRINYEFTPKPPSKEQLIDKYIQGNRIPWSEGYSEFKEQSIINNLSSEEIINCFKKQVLPSGYGLNLDERIVEYPWIYSCLYNDVKGTSKKPFKTFLDAGSTFNFDYILNKFHLKKVDATIYTYHPEGNCYWKDRISYVYGDLRVLPFRDNFFDVVVCHSTLEHIDMDNSMYGYDLKNVTAETEKSYEYLKVINEIIRVVNRKGSAILTFPYGKYERHGFFQQFDREMLDKILILFEREGLCETTFLRYESMGWQFAGQSDCDNSISYNPHTGIGKLNDNAAHSRAIACINFRKK